MIRHFTEVLHNATRQELDKTLDERYEQGHYVVNIAAIHYEGTHSVNAGHFDWMITYKG